MKTTAAKISKPILRKKKADFRNHPMAKRLGFFIENRGGTQVLEWFAGGCRPAEDTELALWRRLIRLNDAAKRVLADIDEDQVAEAKDVAVHELRKASV